MLRQESLPILGPRGRAAARCGLIIVLALHCAAAGGDSPPAVTHDAVDRAIERARAWLWSQKNEDGHWEVAEIEGDTYWGGNSALALLALLYAGEPPQTDDMDAALSWLGSQTLNGTYVYGTRAHALALVPGAKFRSRLESDLKWLTDNVAAPENKAPGAYSYTAELTAGGSWDNSNSQYGVLGVWMATEAGFYAPTNYWSLIADHWILHQQRDGGWAYTATGRSTGSMTAAGLATLFVVLDRTYGNDRQLMARVIGGIERGLNWLGREYTPENPFGERRWLYYYLYGIERAGRASGYKHFRNKDWFQEGAAFLLAEQREDGSWPGTGESVGELRNTAFALMFLCHGRAPVLFARLQLGEDWDPQHRDVAGLVAFAQRTLERLLNWYIVTLDAPLDDLLEAPVLYLRGEQAWEFSDEQVQKLREYAMRGGMILAVAGRRNPDFLKSVRGLAERAFAEFPVRPLPPSHALFSGEVQFSINVPPPMQEVTNGLRTLMLISEDDLGAAWTGPRLRQDFAQLGVNIYTYATDKGTPRSRLESPVIPLEPRETKRKLSVVVIRHEGNWNIEPYGWTRLKNHLHNEAGTQLLVTHGLRLDDAALQDFKIAVLTGMGRFSLSAAEKQGLRDFLRGGGTLIANAGGGSDEFDKAFQEVMQEVQRDRPARLPADSYIITGEGIPDAVDLTSVGYTRTARGYVRGQAPPLFAFESGRRIAVLYSPLDISAGLLGTPIYDRRGYDPQSCLLVMRNLLLYADLPTREKSALLRQ